ncbi:MAG: NUDIX hydrolase [Myxococcota bacterium]|nr:NUDIX hydrolase [Myxococcota bacterium]
MSRPKPWEVLETEALQDCAVFSVSRAWTRSPHSGERVPFYRLESSDWVNVVPVTAEGEIVMVHQWRHGAQALTLEIPGGLVDPGEAPEDAALRELLEETGYRSERAVPIGELNPNPALFTNRVYTYVAPDARRVGPVSNSGHEETKVELVPMGQVRDRLRRGEIDHALVAAALYWWELQGGLE